LGLNFNGQLGDGKATDSSVPVDVTDLIGVRFLRSDSAGETVAARSLRQRLPAH
jgi:hypothetical protein